MLYLEALHFVPSHQIIMTIYEDDAPHVLGAIVTLMILAFTTFGLRVYVRYGPTWGFEDTVMAAAVVSIFVYVGKNTEDVEGNLTNFILYPILAALHRIIHIVYSRRAERRRSAQGTPRVTRERAV